MSDKKESYEDTKASTHSRSTRRKPALPNIHPDDAKDKVFTAILKALLKKGNKPSSPKELANDIVKHKYATLGGATPFATVSSRISQHFKRAAAHNPPRAPLLAKHVDERHSRKINYSLITPGDNAKSTTTSASTSPLISFKSSQLASTHQQEQHPLAQQHELSTSEGNPSQASDISSDEEQQEHQGQNGINRGPTESRPVSRAGSKSTSITTRISLRRRQRLRNSDEKRHYSDSDHEPPPEPKRTKRDSSTNSIRPSNTSYDSGNLTLHAAKSPVKMDPDEDSEADYSDYYEEMMKGDETMAHIEISRRRSSIFRRPSTVNSGVTSTIAPNINNSSNNHTTDSPKLVGRKLSLPLNGLLGENEFWTPYTFEQDLANDSTFIPDTHNTSHQQQVPLNIVSPESISETELDLYFGGPTFSNTNGNNNSSTSSNNNITIGKSNKLNHFSARTSRKSFCALSNGKEASLLHRALMANSAREANSGDGSTSSNDQSVESTMSDDDDDDDENDDIHVPVRRKSWPLTHAISQSPEFLMDSKSFLEQIRATNNKETRPTRPQDPFSERIGGDDDDERNQVGVGKKEDIGTNGAGTVAAATFDGDDDDKEAAKETNDKLKDYDDATTPVSKTYSENGHRFTITKLLLGNLQCYELDSPDDIPDTKVLRFIASNDGASEHVALRTRHADAAKQDQRRNSQHFYLVEGCVNATQLRKAARPVLGKGSFDAAAEVEEGRLVITITKGPMECRGAWVTLGRARELVDEFEIESSPGLTKLLGDDPMGENDSKNRKSSTRQSMDASSSSPSSLMSVATGKPGSLSAPVSSDEADDDEFVQFEEDEKAPTTSTENVEEKSTSVPVTTTPATTTAITAPISASATDPPVNTQPFNLAAIPGLAQLNPTLDLARTFTSYMQAVAKATSGSQASSSSSTTPSLAFDLKTALSRFPALDALLKKDSPLSTPHPTTVQSLPTSPTSHTPYGTDTNKMYPTTPTNPPMYITVIDNVTVCVATLNVPSDHGDKTYKVLRRLDTGYVNGTSLLTAGGIDTERERSMILSFEMERIRIPNKDSELCGTWIPLRRAQELAVTCSIQNRLGPFLSDRVESYFSPTIPISRGLSGVRSGKPIMGLRRSSSSNELGNNKNAHMMSAAASGLIQGKPASSTQLQHLLLSHPYKTLKLGGGHSSLGMLKAPLLGSFDRTVDLQQKRSISVINSRRPHGTGDNDTSELAVEDQQQQQQQQQRDMDIDILNDDDVDDHDSDADTESDTDVNEVRQRMKRMRDAAIDAMETGQSMDLEELLSRASGPIVQPMRSVQIRGTSTSANINKINSTTIKRRRLFDIDEEGNAPSAFRKPANFLPHGRRRPPTVATHGPHSGKLTTSMIKKSASWNGALPLPRNNIVLPGTKKSANGLKRKKTQKKDVLNSNNNNHVVEHHDGDKKPGSQSILTATAASAAASVAHPNTTIATPPVLSTLPPSPPPSLPAASTVDMKMTSIGAPSPGDGNPDHRPTVPDTTVKVSKPSVSDDDEDEEIDIGGSDDDDDVR